MINDFFKHLSDGLESSDVTVTDKGELQMAVSMTIDKAQLEGKIKLDKGDYPKEFEENPEGLKELAIKQFALANKLINRIGEEEYLNYIEGHLTEEELMQVFGEEEGIKGNDIPPMPHPNSNPHGGILGIERGFDTMINHGNVVGTIRKEAVRYQEFSAVFEWSADTHLSSGLAEIYELVNTKLGEFCDKAAGKLFGLANLVEHAMSDQNRTSKDSHNELEKSFAETKAAYSEASHRMNEFKESLEAIRELPGFAEWHKNALKESQEEEA